MIKMSAEKLSNDAVPSKFIEWLLSMGCPAYKVPNLEKMTEMCRGQYYLVWRSLMERVEPKQTIKEKRLQVFCNDVMTVCNQNKEANSSTVVPEELLLWREQTELRQKVKEAEERVSQYRNDLNLLTENVSKKVQKRNASRRTLEDLQRRTYLLQSLAEELKNRQEKLLETKTIADALCSVDEGDDVQEKLHKCITSLKKQGVQGLTMPTANISVVSNSSDNEFEEQLLSAMRCRGDAVSSQLYARRASLLPSTKEAAKSRTQTLSPQRVVAHTAALHCTLALHTAKTRVHIDNTTAKLTPAVIHLNNNLSTESCELLVQLCEKENLKARVRTLRSVLDEITTRSGIFQLQEDVEKIGATKSLAAIDKIIISKRDELKQVMASLNVTERKIQNVKECLTAVFNSFRDMTPLDNDKYKALQIDMPRENLSSMIQFYESHRERRASKVNLSMELDASECSYSDVVDMSNPRFIDEINFYLNKFSLEKNRKLVLESGEKIWIFETIGALASRIHDAWVTNDVTCDLLCPSDSLTNNLRRLALAVQRQKEMELKARAMECTPKICDVDIKLRQEEEDQVIDKIKKKLTENFSVLHKTRRTLDSGEENLKFWQENPMKEFISPKRLVDGVSYRQYEENYLESI